jgi:hypothetical protein
MKKGLQLLNNRTSKAHDNTEFLNIKSIPESFKIFVSQFELGYSMLDIQRVKINEAYEFFVEISMFENELINDEYYSATIDYIFDFPDLANEYENYSNRTDRWHELGFMKIGLLFHGDVLLLGISNSVYGEIWRFGNGLLKTQCCKLDNNIFDFFARLKQKVDEEQLSGLGLSIDLLYKNYGEEFWRVRAENI